MIYVKLGSEGLVVSFKESYGNFINGEWVVLVKGEYFIVIFLVDGSDIV